MTLYRWVNDPNLEFPSPIKINRRIFFKEVDIDDFLARMARKSLSERNRVIRTDGRSANH